MRCLSKHCIDYNFIHTGQHRETMDDMLVEFNLKQPDIRLYGGADIVSIGRMLTWTIFILWKSITRRTKIFKNDRKGIVLIHGDTFSTILGALMGRLAGLDVGHVESGLRSYNFFNPFPEELTRVLVFYLSHILFCPGEWALNNVKRLRKKKINTKTNTMSDTLEMALQKNLRTDHIPATSYAIVSIHRYENIFEKKRLDRIVELLEHVARKHHLVFILHPPTEKRLRATNNFARLKENPLIELRNRYSYFDFVALLQKCQFVVTDGGSLQEETSYLGVPCLLLRKHTERVEGLNWNVVLSNYEISVIDNFIGAYEKYRKKSISNVIGPSEIIVESILMYQ